MARQQVQVIGHSTAEPDALWQVVGDFCGLWHPAIATMRAEVDAKGHLTRAFTVKGEAKTYRECLTYFSDSDRVMAYAHAQGIEGVESYTARLGVSGSEKGGSVIAMSAQIVAPTARAAEIASGTEAIFKAGLAALANCNPGVPATPILPAPMPTEILLLDDLPRLALTITPARPDAPLCLFLHGIGGGRQNWAPQLARIGHQAQCAALDLRGYGQSTLGPDASTIEDYCTDILRVADHLGAKKLVLVGLSYGSWIATSFAMRHPGRLAGLVLSGGCTGMSEAGASEREAFRLSREVPMNAGQVPADFAPAVVNVIAGPDASPTLRADLLASMAAIPAATYRDALSCFTNPLERFDFSRLTMPVLLMTGAQDRLAPPAEIRGIAERILDAASVPDVRFEVIENAGHVCNLESPDAYNRHLSDFVARLVP